MSKTQKQDKTRVFETFQEWKEKYLPDTKDPFSINVQDLAKKDALTLIENISNS